MKFIVKLFGGAGIVPLEYDRLYAFRDNIIQDVSRSLSHYYPVYTTACIWEDDGEGETTLIAEFKANVKVERVISSSKMTDEQIEAHDREEYRKAKQS